MSTNQPTHLRTDELEHGTRLLIDGRLVRTVDRVEVGPYLNYRNEPIYNVEYVEGRTDEWSAGNSGIASTTWRLADAR
jgi:hypothetical protein